MGLKNLENFLGNHIEGFFNRRFASALEPAELVRALEQGLLRSKKKVGDEVLLPNDCSLLLGEEDYQRLCAARMLDELYEAADRLVIREDCFLDGKLRIRMEKKEGLTGVEVVCSDTTRETSEQEEPHTLVLERRKFDAPLNLPKKRRIAVLRVLEGPDQDASLVIGESQIYVGRREKNDFLLTDVNASRVHAYIVYARHRHILHDAGSLNGTYVNRKRKDCCCLCHGDEIQMGSTVIAYEVI